jgi:chemotaxis family two-component system response regulator Rcp1
MEVRPRFRILIVDDSPSDIFIAQEALKQLDRISAIDVAEDGVEAMEFLRREGKHKNAQRPDLILLDLNMPRKDGREVLAELKADEILRRIPVIVLTSSSADSDILKAYNLHANCYVTKPADFNQFKETLRALEMFWFRTVTFPPE